MALDAWLERIENLHPVKWDLGLERVGEVGRRLDVLKPAPLTFLVAGTNGKGTTCAAIACLCRSAGLSVGVSTSPHLIHFNERIVVDGKAASDDEICEAFDAIEAARGETSLSYFEFGALAAMLVFRRRNVDVAVLEIGLGGRLDAMNIVSPDVSVITRIALDHQSWLGDDRETIAREKAGVMRDGKPCVVADEAAPASLAACATETGSSLYCIDQEFGVDAQGAFFLTGDGEKRTVPSVSSELPLASVLAALQAVSLAGVDADLQSLEGMSVPGRCQRVEGAPRETIVDVGHNPDAARWLAARLSEIPQRRCHAVIGMYADKDHEGVIRELLPHVDRWYVTATGEDRAMPAVDLAAVLSRLGGSVAGTYAKVALAYDEALTQSNAEDRILILGSFPIVGDALRHLGKATL